MVLWSGMNQNLLSAGSAPLSYLLGGPLVPHRHRVVTFVFLFHALGAHALLVAEAVEPQQLVVLLAELLPQVIRGCDQLVGLPVEALVVGSQVSLTVRLQARQAGFDSSGFPPRANAAFHLFRSGQMLSSGLNFASQKLVHHLSQNRVPPQERFRAELLPTLRAAVVVSVLRLAPVVFNAVQTVAVSTGDGRGVP